MESKIKSIFVVVVVAVVVVVVLCVCVCVCVCVFRTFLDIFKMILFFK